MKVVFNKSGREYATETDSLPEASRNYLMQYGWDQSLQDCIAGLAKATTLARQKAGDSAAAVVIAVEKAIAEKLQKRMDSIKAGTMGLPVARDPIRTLAAEYVAKALKKKGAQVTKDRFTQLVEEKMVSSRDFLTAELARRDAAEGFDVDVDVESAPIESAPVVESVAPKAEKKGGKK
jgi:hypothetical protein